MRPSLSMKDTPNCRLAHAKMMGECGLGPSPSSQFPHQPHLLTRQFRARVPFTTGIEMRFGMFTSATVISLGLSRAALAYAIMDIIGIRANEEMGRIDATGYVTGVAYQHAFGDRPSSQLICHPVRKANDTPSNADFCSPIAPAIQSAGPQPAGIRAARLVHPRPESLCNRGRHHSLLEWATPAGWRRCCLGSIQKPLGVT